jgi:hypothetical protein
MNKAIMLVVNLGMAVLCIAILVDRRPARQFQLSLPYDGPPRSARGANATLNRVFSGRQSQVVVTARLPFSTIQHEADRAVPQGAHREYTVADSRDLRNVRVKPNLDRDPISLEPAVNSAPPKMQLASRLHGTVEVSGEKRVRANLILTKIDQWVRMTQPDIGVNAEISGWISPGVDANWKFIHQEHLDVNVTQAEFKMFGVFPVSIKEQVQERLNSATPNMIKTALDSIGDKLALRSEVDKLWRELYKPIEISTDPRGYVLLTPQRMRLQQIAFDNPKYLTIRAAVDGKTETLIQEQAPSERTPALLPDLVTESSIAPSFHVTVPVSITLSEVNRSLKGQLGSQIRLAEGETIVVKDCELNANGVALDLKLDIVAASEQTPRQVAGTIFLKSSVVFDNNSRQIRLQGVDFSVETKSMLANTASWLLNDGICRRIEDRFSVDVDAEVKRAQSEVNRCYSSARLGQEVTLSPRLDAVRFGGVSVGDEVLVLELDLGGDMLCEIRVPERR